MPFPDAEKARAIGYLMGIALRAMGPARGSAESPRRTEPVVVVAVRRPDEEAEVGAQAQRNGVGEGAAAHRTATSVVHFVFFLGISFIRKIPIAVVAPLPDVAMHVEEPQIIGPQQSHRTRLPTRVGVVPPILAQQLLRLSH